MRMTLNLDDDAFRLLKSYAETGSLTLSQAASDLLRRTLGAPVQTHMVNGFYTVVPPPGSPRVSSEAVKRLLED
jgi:hypothetical protein